MSSRHRKTIARRTLAFARFLFLQRQAISVSASGLVENQSNCFSPWHCGTPTPRFPRDQRRLDWEIIVFRRDLDDGCTLEIEPAFPARWDSLWGPSNKPFTHTNSVYL